MMVPYVLRAVSPDVVCYTSDYCHWDCVFPDSVRVLAERDDLEPEEKERISRATPPRSTGSTSE